MNSISIPKMNMVMTTTKTSTRQMKTKLISTTGRQFKKQLRKNNLSNIYRKKNMIRDLILKFKIMVTIKVSLKPKFKKINKKVRSKEIGFQIKMISILKISYSPPI